MQLDGKCFYGNGNFMNRRWKIKVGSRADRRVGLGWYPIHYTRNYLTWAFNYDQFWTKLISIKENWADSFQR